ncbi:hypothetical protein [Verrucomicrobium sp. GAS474]
MKALLLLGLGLSLLLSGCALYIDDHHPHHHHHYHRY